MTVSTFLKIDGGKLYLCEQDSRFPDEPPIQIEFTEEVAATLLKHLQATRSRYVAPTPVPQGSILRFDEFWAIYPRRVAKPDALKAWRSLGGDKAADVILAGVRKRLFSEDWLKDEGKFIPHPATFLRQRRWEDDTPEEDVKGGKWL